MTNIKHQYRIETPAFPIDGYNFNVQVWTSVDGGKTFGYCGIGRFCKTGEEVAEYIEKYKAEHPDAETEETKQTETLNPICLECGTYGRECLGTTEKAWTGCVYQTPKKKEKETMCTKNTRIDYLYRDACNYKVYQYFVIQGPITPEQIQLILESCLDGEYFIPSNVHPWMPEQRFDGYDPLIDDDYFEIGKYSFSSTQEEATIPITADELVKRFQAAKTW